MYCAEPTDTFCIAPGTGCQSLSLQQKIAWFASTPHSVPSMPTEIEARLPPHSR